MTKVPTTIADDAANNIKAAQKKQTNEIMIVYICLKQKNFKQSDRKGGKFSQKWLGRYTVMNIPDKGVATLKNTSGVTLRNKYNIVQLKHYIQGADNKSKSISNE